MQASVTSDTLTRTHTQAHNHTAQQSEIRIQLIAEQHKATPLATSAFLATASHLELPACQFCWLSFKVLLYITGYSLIHSFTYITHVYLVPRYIYVHTGPTPYQLLPVITNIILHNTLVHNTLVHNTLV